MRLAEYGGGFPRGKWSAVFPLFNVQTSTEDLIGELGAPRSDVRVYVVGAQDVEPFPSNRARGPAPLAPTPRELHDPAGVTLQSPSWQNATAGERILFLGFPGSGPYSNQLAASVGRVLSDDEAQAAIASLQRSGDVEGRIPYDAEAEFLLEGHALPGMSGGGVFNRGSQQVGIAVRASFADIGVQYVRVVRMSFLVARMSAALAEMDEAARVAVSPYLEISESPSE